MKVCKYFGTVKMCQYTDMVKFCKNSVVIMFCKYLEDKFFFCSCHWYLAYATFWNILHTLVSLKTEQMRLDCSTWYTISLLQNLTKKLSFMLTIMIQHHFICIWCTQSFWQITEGSNTLMYSLSLGSSGLSASSMFSNLRSRWTMAEIKKAINIKHNVSFN